MMGGSSRMEGEGILFLRKSGFKFRVCLPDSAGDGNPHATREKGSLMLRTTYHSFLLRKCLFLTSYLKGNLFPEAVSLGPGAEKSQ